jgi:hypothetical protein
MPRLFLYSLDGLASMGAESVSQLIAGTQQGK